MFLKAEVFQHFIIKPHFFQTKNHQQIVIFGEKEFEQKLSFYFFQRPFPSSTALFWAFLSLSAYFTFGGTVRRAA